MTVGDHAARMALEEEMLVRLSHSQDLLRQIDFSNKANFRLHCVVNKSQLPLLDHY